MPQEVEHVWRWFWELASARSGSGFGGNPISYVDIAAWSRLTDQHPTPWEVTLIRRVDSAVLAVQAKESNPKTREQGKKGEWCEPDHVVPANDVRAVQAIFAKFPRVVEQPK